MSPEDATKWIELLKSLFPGLPVGILVFGVLYLAFPKMFEKGFSRIWKLLSFLGTYFQKHYLKYDLQSRIGLFVDQLAKEVPELETTYLNVEWVEGGVDRQSFIDDGVAYLRLKEDDPDDKNFAHGAFMFVSSSLLFRAKKYVSASQRESIDLFVTMKLIQNEKPSVVSWFLDDFLHPATLDSKSKKSIFIDKFSKIDEAGLYFPILLQELFFLGNKAFGKRQDDLIISEVNGLVNFLENVSLREIGDESIPLDFEQNYCKCGIVIIGKSNVLRKSIVPYISYLNGISSDKKLETVYILSNFGNRRQVNTIVKSVRENYEKVTSKPVQQKLRWSDGSMHVTKGYVVVLKAKNVPIYHSSES